MKEKVTKEELATAASDWKFTLEKESKDESQALSRGLRMFVELYIAKKIVQVARIANLMVKAFRYPW